MNTAPLYVDTRTRPEWSTSDAPRELEPREVDVLVYGTCLPPDDEYELIEMRYQQLLARMILEEFFSEAHLTSR